MSEYVIWFQGGPLDDTRVPFQIDPGDEVWATQDSEGNWYPLLLLDGTAFKVSQRYVRVASVEQFDFERIYYPADA